MRLSDLSVELRRAAGALRRSPGPFAAGVITITLAIAASTAIFALVDHVLLRPLPVHDQDTLVVLRARSQLRDLEHYPYTEAAWTALRENARTLEAVAAFDAFGSGLRPVTGPAELVSARVARVGGDFFGVLGTSAVRGRLIDESENVQNGPRLAVIGWGFWQRAFGGSDEAIGATIGIDEIPHTVIGVLPRSFDFPRTTDIWIGLGPTLAEASPGSWRELYLIARRRADASLDQIHAETATLLASTAELRQSYEGVFPVVESFASHVHGDLRPLLLAMLASAILVSLVAGTNLANMLLVRAIDGRRALAVRRALGARGLHVAAPLLGQSLLLCALGGVAGTFAAHAGLRLLLPLAPAGLIQRIDVRVDGRVLAFAMVLMAALAIIFGVGPAMRAALREDAGLLHGSMTRATNGRAAWRSMVIAIQAALAVTAVIGAG
ncbi:MAG: ABC transporter permease, partial [Gemmatimonadetes bacterium]|nr:ABC transporter permease [Gemmatimonadota bacterium]